MFENLNDKNSKGYLIILFAGIMNGTAGIFVSFLSNAGASPITIVLLRFGAASLIALPLIILFYGFTVLYLHPKQYLICAAISLFGLTLNSLFYYTTMDLIGIATASVLDYTGPAFVCIFATIIFKDPFTPNKVLSVIINFTGCTLMVTGGNFSSLSFSLIGLLTGLLSGLCYASMTLMLRAWGKDLNPLVVTFYGFVFGFLFLLVLHPFSICDISLNGSTFLMIFLLGLIPSVGGIGGYYKGISMINDTTIAPVLCSTESIISCLIGFLVFHESFNSFNIAGIILVLLSIYLINRGDSTIQKTKERRF